MRYIKPIAILCVLTIPLVYLFAGTDGKSVPARVATANQLENGETGKAPAINPAELNSPIITVFPSKGESKAEADSEPVDQIISDSPIDRIRAIKEKTALHQAVLQDHDAYKRYPSSNISIEEGSKDPISLRYEIDERTTENEDRTAVLTVWTDKKFYQRGDQVQLFAKLLDMHGTPINTRFSAQLIYDEQKGLQVLDLEYQNNGIHQISFTTAQYSENAMPAGNYKLLVVNSADKVADAAVFTLTDPVAAFTGQYRDTVNQQGNLIVEAEVEVTQKEKLYFQASLYTELNEAIGVTQNTYTLEPGKHWVPLEFYGLMLHDSREDGPYLLKNISLARVTMPLQRGPLLKPGYLTQPYERNQFSDRAYDELAAR